MATRGLPDALGTKNFKTSGTSEGVGCILAPNWEAKMEIQGKILCRVHRLSERVE
jgi:hypothetical protein